MSQRKNNGYNKLLLEARLHKKLSRKKAAKALNISRTKLMRIEKGYAIVQEKDQDVFIDFYHLDKDFFKNDFCYPVPVDIKSYDKKKPSKFYLFFLSTKFKVLSIIISLGFIAQTVCGAMCLPAIRGNTSSFFANEIKTTYQYVLNVGEDPSEEDKNSELGMLVIDKRKIVELKGEHEDKFESLKINYFVHERNLPYAFLQGKYEHQSKYKVIFEHRYLGNYSYRAHCYLANVSDDSKIISRMTCDINKVNLDNYHYTFKTVNSLGEETKLLNENDPLYQEYTGIFKQYYTQFDTDLNKLFDNKLVATKLTYTTYSLAMNNNVTSFSSYRYTMQMLFIWGIIFTAISIILTVISFIKKSHFKKKLAILDIPDEIEKDDYSDVKVREKLSPLPKNKGVNLLINEFSIRTISLLFLFLSSMVTFFVFLDALNVSVIGAYSSDMFRNLVSNLSIVAVLLLYFLKLDIYQNKKNAAAFSWFLFITGLLYYLVIVAVYFILENVTGSTDVLGTILNYLPGNIIWAVLVFNAINIFLFSKPNFKNPTKSKRLAFRLCVIIPLSYLIISCIVSIGMKLYDWNIHYLISSLLFFKAPYITVFAFLYTAFVFIYRRHTVRKYGESNALLYQQGNKYNLNRNIFACLIILVLGLIDLLFMFIFPNNKLSFGTNAIILIAIPLLLFYRPHFGKRNATWDLCFNLLYVFVYIAGILSIAMAVINFLTTI